MRSLSAIYTEPRTLLPYDDNRYIVYLNEEVIEDYVPNYGGMIGDDDYQPQPCTGYKYTGAMPDGGTLIECKSANRNDLINGIIRSRYTQSEEDAIKTHQIELLRNDLDEAKYAEYSAEWEEFNAFRAEVKAQVDKWLNA